MATERQVAANRANASRSTGPRTAEGKEACRRNARKHGLAAEATVDPGKAQEHDDRLRAWRAEFRPGTVEGAWALDRAVAATFQIEQSERDFDALAVEQGARARLCWDDDRRAAAAELAARLAKEPARVARRLESTKQGCELMIARWGRLGEALEADGGWGDAEVSAALDLLGVLPELRRGRTPVDRADGTDPAPPRADLVRREVARLKRRLSDALDALDDLARRQAEAGAMLPLTGPGQLLIRYGRDAWRRYHKAMKAVQAPAPEADPTPPPPPAPVSARPVEGPEESDEPEPEPAPRAERERFPTTPEEIRATLAAIESRLHAATTDGERQAVLAEMDAAMVMLGPELGLDIASILPAPSARPNRHARRAIEARSRRS